MDLHLIIHNVGNVASLVFSIGIAVFLLINNHKKTVNIVFALVNIFVAIFMLSHLLGVNTTDPSLSRIILFFNLAIIPIVIFTLHTVFAIVNKTKSRRKIMMFIYGVGILMIIWYLIFPDSFLLDSVPKMYFPNYYNPGQFHWVMRVVFDFIVPIYLLWELYDSYKHETDSIERNRAKYFIFTIILGYVVGSIPIFLVYNIHIDPAWGIWFVPLYSIPFVYGAVTYELVDVRIIAKRAFLYALAITGIGGIISVFNLMSQFVTNIYPEFPFWISPIVSALIAVGIGIIVWKRLREGDILKYEFITVATHKFRTPLTHIKWATENLSNVPMQSEGKEQLDYIRSANGKLIELTNLLMSVSESGDKDYSYHFQKTEVSALVKEVLASLNSQLEAKKLTLDKYIEPDMFVSADPSRLKFVIQVFVENAIQYTPLHGLVTVSTKRRGDDVIFSVSDTGIGISKADVPLLFSKFYRSKEAKLADTEGMGIGLFISKESIKRHRGKIWAESLGPNSGSAFSFSLLAVK